MPWQLDLINILLKLVLTIIQYKKTQIIESLGLE